ncbi:uncharacterized protein LOC144104730 [Amblyomma americanum]
MPKRRHEEDDCAVESDPFGVKLLEAFEVAPPQALEMMGRSPSRYAGLAVDHRRPCTSQEGRLCHIFGSLKAWNRLLWMIGLELQEMSASELSVVAASDGTCLRLGARLKDKLKVALYMYHLIAQHHCVVEATINDDIIAGLQGIMCRTIRDSRGLKRITLSFSPPRMRISLRDVAEAIASLTRLESLSLRGDIQGTFLGHLMPLLAGTASLTVFRASNMHVHNPPVNIFRGGLLENGSIKELSLHAKLLDGGSRRCGPGNLDHGLARYLQTNTSLTSLKITDPLGSSEVDVWTICLALSENTVLSRLDLNVFMLKFAYATPIKCLLNRSKTLKFFTLTYSFIERNREAASEDRASVNAQPPMQFCRQCQKYHSEETQHVARWITALLTDSTSLKELTFSMSGFCLLECKGFLRAIARNKTLEKLTFTDLHENTLDMCSALCESGVQKRVLVDSRCIVYYPDIGLEPWRGAAVGVTFGILQAAADRVTTSGNLTEITLQVFSILCATGATDPAKTDIVQLIQRAPCIKDLVLDLKSGCCSECWNQCAPAICDAVYHNPTIRTLDVRFSSRCRLDMAPLASLMHRSRTLRAFTLKPPCPAAFTEFVAELLKPEFENIYTLHSLQFTYEGGEMVKERLDIQGIVHRNRALPKRAAAYVTGTSAKYTADAFEKVSESPALIEELQSVASIEEAGAKQLIAKSTLRLADFTEFMRLAGVVFDSVECNPSEDGKKQLDDLPEPCLRHIRKFVRLSDVLDAHH